MSAASSGLVPRLSFRSPPDPRLAPVPSRCWPPLRPLGRRRLAPGTAPALATPTRPVRRFAGGRRGLRPATR